MVFELVMLSSHLILCHPPSLLPSIFPSIRVFFNESALCIRWPKYCSFSFTTQPSMNIKGWFPLGLTGLISLLSKGLSRVFSSTTVWKHQFCGAQPSLWSNSQIHTWLPEKTIALTIRTLVAKVISLPFKTLSRFVVALLPRGKPLLTSRFQLLSTVILDPKKIVCHCF